MTRPNDSYIKTCVIIHTVGELKDSTNGYHEWVYSNTAVRYTVARFSRNSSANLRKKKTNKSQTEVPSKLLKGPQFETWNSRNPIPDKQLIKTESLY